MNTETNRLREALSLLEGALGPDLIKREVHKINGWNPEGAPGLHPLVLLWYKTREDLALVELTGSLPRSRWVQETLQLGESLKELAKHPLYPEILDKLKDPANWQSAVHQMKNLQFK
ncbi:hypothetical protein [Desulforamulus putei]|uniref:hypothetical protein n=1 Tax=Desulforamulus putei TaxID=74701 RepID=UPI002FDCC7C8